MGRKAIAKERKTNATKMGNWAQTLFPFFQKHGLHHVTMDDIAEHLGKSKTTLYDYFQTKEDLLSIIMQEKIQAIRGFIPYLEDEKQNFKARYMNAIAFISIQLADITTLFLKDLHIYFPQIWVKVQDFIDESSKHLNIFYQKGIEAGQFNTFNTSVLVLTDQLFFHALTDPELLERHNLSVNTAFIEYLNVRFEGLLKK